MREIKYLRMILSPAAPSFASFRWQLGLAKSIEFF
jgi:hypothetical protein